MREEAIDGKRCVCVCGGSSGTGSVKKKKGQFYYSVMMVSSNGW